MAGLPGVTDDVLPVVPRDGEIPDMKERFGLVAGDSILMGLALLPSWLNRPNMVRLTDVLGGEAVAEVGGVDTALLGLDVTDVGVAIRSETDPGPCVSSIPANALKSPWVLGVWPTEGGAIDGGPLLVLRMGLDRCSCCCCCCCCGGVMATVSAPKVLRIGG